MRQVVSGVGFTFDQTRTNANSLPTASFARRERAGPGVDRSRVVRKWVESRHSSYRSKNGRLGTNRDQLDPTLAKMRFSGKSGPRPHRSPACKRIDSSDGTRLPVEADGACDRGRVGLEFHKESSGSWAELLRSCSGAVIPVLARRDGLPPNEEIQGIRALERTGFGRATQTRDRGLWPQTGNRGGNRSEMEVPLRKRNLDPLLPKGREYPEIQVARDDLGRGHLSCGPNTQLEIEGTVAEAPKDLKITSDGGSSRTSACSRATRISTDRTRSGLVP